MGLGSILGGIGSIVAAPFTGGTSLAWLPAALAGGGAVIDGITSRGGGARQPGQQSSSAMASGLSPELDRMLQQIIAQGQARNARTEPLHQAAMLMASRMAPTWINSGGAPPRLQSAIQSAGAPRPRTSFSPEVMEAIQRLSGRFSA